MDDAFAGKEMALFGMGCFWGAEKGFWLLPGVHSTSVGYAGGYTPNASYEEVCSGQTGHTEVVRVVFDPAVTSYEAMLKQFWEGHDPTQGMRQGADVGTQYRSAIYYYNEAQRRAAEHSRDEYQKRLTAAGFGHDHDGDCAGARILLRRGLPSAVPRQESPRLLRPRRHGRQLSNRRDGHDLAVVYTEFTFRKPHRNRRHIKVKHMKTYSSFALIGFVAVFAAACGGGAPAPGGSGASTSCSRCYRD